MADARTFFKLPNENMGAFNKRLRTACEEQDITNVMLHAIDGEPVITLFSEIFEATAEDVAEAKEEDPDSELKVGDDMPEEPPVFVQVAQVGCIDATVAATSQTRMETLYERAGGQVVKLLKDTCSHFGMLKTPGPNGKEFYGEETITYMAVVAYIPDEDDDDGGQDDAAMESNLRRANA